MNIEELCNLTDNLTLDKLNKNFNLNEVDLEKYKSE